MPLHCSDQKDKENINLFGKKYGNIYWQLRAYLHSSGFRIHIITVSPINVLQYILLAKLKALVDVEQSTDTKFCHKYTTFSCSYPKKTTRNIYGAIHKDTIGILREVTLKHSCMVYFSKCGEWSLNSGSSIMVCFSS